MIFVANLASLTVFTRVLEDNVYFIPEIDGIRIVSNEKHEFLQKVPSKFLLSFEVILLALNRKFRLVITRRDCSRSSGWQICTLIFQFIAPSIHIDV